jgi:hypothetical protein
MTLVRIPSEVKFQSFNPEDGPTRSTTVWPGLKSLCFALSYRTLITAQSYRDATLTSSNLKAARLFRPWTRASLAKKSLPCRDFHLVEDEEA